MGGRRTRAAAAVTAALTLAGCGGASNKDDPAEPTASAAPAPTAIPAGTAFPGTGATVAVSTRIRPGQIHGFVEPLPATGEPVRITSARPATVSAGLRVRSLRLRAGTKPGTAETFDTRSWPAKRYDDGPLVGSTFTGRRQSTVLGLSAAAPGVYVLDGLDLRYRQGGDARRQTLEARYCVVVGPGPGGCVVGDDLRESRAPIKGLGGPIPEDAALRRTDDEESTLGVEAVVKATPGPHDLEIGVTNTTDRRIDVAGVGLTGIRNVGGQSLRPGRPDTKTRVLLPGRSATFPTRFFINGCRGKDAAGLSTQLTAGATVDGRPLQFPLGVPIAFDRAPRC